MLHRFRGPRFRFALDLRSPVLSGFGLGFLLDAMAGLMNPTPGILSGFRKGLLLVWTRVLWTPLVMFSGMAVLLMCPQIVY